MNLSGYIAPLILVVVCAFFGYIFFILFTRSGREFEIRRQFGDILQDFGVIQSAGPETVRLYKCARGSEVSFVLLVSWRALGAAADKYVKLGPDAVQKLLVYLRQ